MLYLKLDVRQTLHIRFAGSSLGLDRREQWFQKAEPVAPQRLTDLVGPGKSAIRTRSYGNLHAEKHLQRRHKRLGQPIMSGRPTF